MRLGSIALWLLCSACAQESPERSPLASDRCGGEPCERPAFGGITGRTVFDAGVAPGDAGQASEFLADVVVLFSPDFQQAQPLSAASLDVIVESSDGLETSVRTSEPRLTLSALGRPPYWAKLRQRDGTADLMGSLVPFADTSDGRVLPIVERQVLQDITDNLAGNPVPPNPLLGHAFVSFLREGLPLPGVSVTLAQGTVAYDAGFIYSDVLIETGERGMVALLNMPAVPFPGGSTSIQFSFEQRSTLLRLQLAQDAVTLVTVELD